MKLIDKDALVSEIERRKEVNFKQSERFKHSKESLISRVSEDVDILSFLDTLEVKEVDTEQLDKLLNWWKEVTTEYSAYYKVKEVDLEKEIESYFKGFGKFPSVGIDDCIDIAKHFFELGIQAQQQ